MLTRIGSRDDVAPGHMQAFDVVGTKNVFDTRTIDCRAL